MTPREVALSVCSEHEDDRVVSLVERAIREDRRRARERQIGETVSALRQEQRSLGEMRAGVLRAMLSRVQCEIGKRPSLGPAIASALGRYVPSIDE